jgi:putative methanogenesis marker 16 metalloprotein
MTKRTIQEINAKLSKGEAVVMTATELCDLVRAGEKVTMDDVDVVTSATRAIMSGTMAVLSFRVSGKKQFVRAAEVFLDGVPATIGPAPNENLGWIDCVVMGTAKNTKNGAYGGGHLFRDLAEGKEIEVIVKTIDGKEFTTQTSLNHMPYALLFHTRGVCALMVYTNPAPEPISTIFSVNEFAGSLSEATFSGCGELSPIRKDPNFHTFGIGTKILLNGSIGYIVGKGTLSSPRRHNFSGFADLHGMDPEYMGGFKTSHSPDVVSTWAVPIPILNEEVLKTACITDDQIEIPIVNVYGRDQLGTAHYSDVWIADGLMVKYDKNKCKALRSGCKDSDGNFTCPPQNLCPLDAFTLDEPINYKRCFYCGTCVAFCLQEGVCNSKLGKVSIDKTEIPIVLRHSDRIRAEKIAKKLKVMLANNEFSLSEPVGTINYC